MKTLLPLLLVMTLGLLPGWCGGLINLNNNFTLPGTSTKAFILGADGRPMAKALGRVEVFDATGALIRSGGLAANGLFFLGVTEIPGTVPGGSGNITIRVWDSSTGDSWETAQYKLGTVVTLFDLGGGSAPPSSLASGSDFAGLQCLCNPWPTDPWAWLSGVKSDGNFMTISGSSSPISTGHWNGRTTCGDGAGSRISLGFSAILHWTLPKPTSDTVYFRVVKDP